MVASKCSSAFVLKSCGLISILVHSVAAVLDPRVCATIHVFHAFTGFSSVLILKYTCTDFRGKILKEYTKALKFGVYNEHTEVLTLPSLPCLLALPSLLCLLASLHYPP